MLDAFDLLGFAAVIADDEGEVHQGNSRSEVLLPRLFAGHSSADPDHRQLLSDLVLCALGAEATGQDCAPATLDLRGGRPVIVHAVLAGSPLLGEGAARFAVLMLIRPSEPRELSVPILQGAFGLTKSEILLARYLCLGKSLKEIARIRDTSIATLRVQLRGLFAKTRTKRQAELVALLTRLPPPMHSHRLPPPNSP